MEYNTQRPKSSGLNKVASIILMVCFIPLAFIFWICFFISFSEPIQGDVIILFFIFALVGTFFSVVGIKRLQLGKLFEKYLDYILDDPKRSINNLALCLEVSPYIVKKNLAIMIKMRYFKSDIYIDEINDVVIINNEIPGFQSNYRQKSQKQESVNYISVTCKGCGAVAKIKAGTSENCEYCGATIAT